MSNSPLGYTNLGEWDISPPQGRTPFDMNQHAVRARSVRLLATIKSGNICWRAFRIRLRFDWARHLFDGKLRRPSRLRTRSPRTSVRVLAHWCASTGRGEGAMCRLGHFQTIFEALPQTQVCKQPSGPGAWHTSSASTLRLMSFTHKHTLVCEHQGGSLSPYPPTQRGAPRTSVRVLTHWCAITRGRRG